MKKLNRFLIMMICALSAPLWAHEGGVALEKARLNPLDKASLQRGAGVFVQYCMGCHSLQYVRYNGLAHDLGIVDRQGAVLDNVIKTQLNFVSDKVTDPLVNSMPKAEAAQWFGVPPPDLSLVARVRGVDWLVSYLKGFYLDASRPWGVNNVVFPSVGMPHVLAELQGPQKAVLAEQHGITQVVGLEPQGSGLLTPAEYDLLVRDVVNFLDYVGEPVKLKRQRLGVWVLMFLTLFLVFAYLLKREYWKDVQ